MSLTIIVTTQKVQCPIIFLLMSLNNKCTVTKETQLPAGIAVKPEMGIYAMELSMVLWMRLWREKFSWPYQLERLKRLFRSRALKCRQFKCALSGLGTTERDP